MEPSDISFEKELSRLRKLWGTLAPQLAIGKFKIKKAVRAPNCFVVQFDNRRTTIFDAALCKEHGQMLHNLVFQKYIKPCTEEAKLPLTATVEVRPGYYETNVTLTEEALDIIGLYWAHKIGLEYDSEYIFYSKK